MSHNDAFKLQVSFKKEEMILPCVKEQTEQACGSSPILETRLVSARLVSDPVVVSAVLYTHESSGMWCSSKCN